MSIRGIKIISGGVLLAAVAGCGTITRGTTEQVAIDVEPKDATVTTSLGLGCTAMPCSIKVPRKEEFTVTASKPGYVTETVEVKTKVSGGGAASVAGNVLVGGVIGAGIDVHNGAGLDHDPNPVVIRLREEGAPASPQKPAQPVSPKAGAKGKSTPVS
ncbi:MAG TPA: translation initiation factor 2 [Rhizobiaceae bacterium]|nr:translation initiation factor 2 [Rhizobiaceae bacterium]